MSNSITFLQGTNGSPATANGNGSASDETLFLQAQVVEIAETNGGTATVTLEGSFDGTNWYAAGYQQTNGTATLTRAATGISVTANSRNVYQVLDPYPQLRARISSIAGSANITAKLYSVG